MSIFILSQKLMEQKSLYQAVAEANLISPTDLVTLRQLLVNSFGVATDDVLVITNPVIDDATATHLKLKGSMQVLKKTTRIAVEFIWDGTELKIVLAAEFGSKWKLRDSFPGLPPSPLDLLEMNGITFFFTTTDLTDYPVEGGQFIPYLKKGQNLVCDFSVKDKLFQSYKAYLPDSKLYLFYTPLDVQGLLRKELPHWEWIQQLSGVMTNMPDFLNVLNPGLGLSINDVRIKAFLVAELRVPNGSLIKVRLEQLTDGNYQLSLGDVRELITPPQVFALMEGRNWFKGIPSKMLSFFVEMTLLDYKVTLNGTNHQMICHEITVASTQAWEVGNLSMIPEIYWKVGDCLHPGEQELIVRGRILVSGFKEAVLLLEEDLSFHGIFDAENDTIQVNDILNTFEGNVINLPGTLHFPIKQMDLTITNALNGDYKVILIGKSDLNLLNFQIQDPTFEWHKFSYINQIRYHYVFRGKVVIGPLSFDVEAQPNSVGWLLKGMTLKEVKMSDLVPSWPFSDVIADSITFEYQITDNADNDSYSIYADFKWKINERFLQLEIDAVLKIEGGSTHNTYTIETEVEIPRIGAQVCLTYILSGAPIYKVQWEGMKFDYSPDQEYMRFAFTGNNIRFLLTAMMKLTGRPYFHLPEPLDQLLDKVGPASVLFDLGPAEKVTLETDLNISILGLDLKKLNVNKDNLDHVFVTITTNQSDLEWDLSDPKEQPNIKLFPDFSTTFDLEWLGLAQRYTMNQTKFDSVGDAVNAMKCAFQNGAGSAELPYDAASQWLMGTEFNLLQYNTGDYFLNMQLVFNDPKLYGLKIALKGELAKLFDGLELEVMYTKLSESKGVYSAELTLPDSMRYIQTPPFTIIIPIFGIKIYTNGDFEIDVGFPRDLDFSRSFTIQAPPYYSGAGGFYLARLKSDASEYVPIATNGHFGQVLAFGLGMALGVGKDFNKGVLKAGFNVSAVGVFEGVLATFHPDNANKEERYFSLDAMLGVIGRIYGSVDFGFVMADLNIAVNLVIRTLIAAYKNLVLELIATVDVSIKYRIKICGVKITAYSSFHTDVNESVDLGGGSKAPWIIEGESLIAPYITNECKAPVWKQLPINRRIKIKTYFVPQLTVDQPKETDSVNAHYVAMLYIKKDEFKGLLESLFLWVLQAFGQGDLDQSNPIITKQVVSDALCWFRDETNGTPMDYDHLVQYFFTDEGAIQIHQPGSDLSDISVFPMVPALSMRVPYYNGTSPVDVDFSLYNELTPVYLDNLRLHFSQVRARYLSELGQSISKRSYSWTTSQKSASKVLFEDFFVSLAKQGLQATMDLFKGDNSLEWDAIKTELESKSSDISAMASHSLLSGMRPPKLDGFENNVSMVCTGNPPVSTMSLYQLTGQQFLLPIFTQVPDCNDYGIKISSNQTWVRLYDSSNIETNEICVSLLREDIANIQELTIEANNGIKTMSGIGILPTMKQVTKWYTLVSPTTVGNLQLWSFPNSLLGLIAKQSPINSSLYAQVNQDGNGDGAIDYRSGVMINVSLKKLPERDSVTGVKLDGALFELVGTDEAGTTLLERWLTSNQGDPEIQVSYSTKSGEWTLGEGIPTVVKSNLSTETNPMNGLSFQNTYESILWAWECSIVRSGGFYLHYENNGNTLPEEIFNEQGIGQIRLILLNEVNSTTLDTYSNCLITMSGQSAPLYMSLTKNRATIANNDDTLMRISSRLSLPFMDTGRLLQNQLLNTIELTIPKSGGFVHSVARSETLLSISESYDVSLESLLWENRNLKNLFLVGDLLDVSWPIQEKVNTMPVGHVGFSVLRDEVADNDTIENYLEQIYRLLGYRIRGNSDFCQSIDGLPVAIHSLNDDEGKYENVVPIFPYAKYNPLNCMPTVPNNYCVPEFDLNPYSGIGKTVQIDFFWHDYFGNQLVMKQFPNFIQIPIGFTDRLLAIEQWPGITTSYTFSVKEMKRRLHIELLLNFELYKQQPNEEYGVYLKRLEADMLIYTKIYYQLCQCDETGNPLVSYKVQTSLDEYADHLFDTVQTDELKAFITDCCIYLNNLLNPLDCDGKSEIRKSLDWLIEDTNPLDIYELKVLLFIERPIDLVDINFKDEDTVRAAVSEIRPMIKENNLVDSDPKMRSLKKFARNFEMVFNMDAYDLKVAMGRTRFGSTGTDADKLWAVRVAKPGITDHDPDATCGDKKGLRYTVGAYPIFFAPKLMSKSKISRLVSIPEFDGATGTLGIYRNQLIGPIDMDNWARLYLSAIENLLSASMGCKVYEKDPPMYRSILSLKEQLAKIIPETLDPILEPTESERINVPMEKLKADAAEKLKQHLLIKLTNAYDIETIVSFPVSVPWSPCTDSQAQLPQLYGGIKVQKNTKPLRNEEQGGTESAYQTSNSKVLLEKGDSALSFTFDAKCAECQSSVTVDLAYEIQHIEHEIGSLPNIDGYKASSWLSFIHPLEQVEIAQGVTVPIPLRFYPDEPKMIRHEGVSMLQGLNTTSEETTVQTAVKWRYGFEFEREYASQDILECQVMFNQKSNAAFMKVEDFYDKLTRCVQVYKKMEEVLKQDNIDEELLLKIVSSFMTLAIPVASSWKEWYEHGNRRAMSVISDTEYRFRILQAQCDYNGEKQLLNMILSPVSVPVELKDLAPKLQIEGCTLEKIADNSYVYRLDNPGGGMKYLSWTDGMEKTKRIIQFDDLHLAYLQDAWAGLMVIRNAELVPGRTTNENFVYRTPVIRFPMKLTPQLDIYPTIHIAAIGAAGGQLVRRSLDEHLTALFTSLYGEMNTGSKIDKSIIKVKPRYQQKLIGNLRFGTLPISLILPSDYQLPVDDDFIKILGGNIRDWYNQVEPFKDGVYQFELTLYTSVDDAKAPLVRLRNLVLDRKDITHE
ncbi:hypothetical protein [Paenibacillus sp. FSL P4-0184]|uniref:hypothetical protein n=1 Tax=Paenibacillus sp. FSL P4-0184 TaxID=2921632 RepID=UPI0030F89E69